MWERGMALLAWKLDGRGTVVGDVVVLGSGVVGGSSGVYRRIRGGGNSKYTASNSNQLKGMTMNCNRCSNVERYTVLGAGVHPGMNTGSGDHRTGCPEGGKDQAGGVVDIRHTCGLCTRGS